jgi:hypothetical protein
VSLSEHIAREVEALFPGSRGFDIALLRMAWQETAALVRELAPAIENLDVTSPAAVAAASPEAQAAVARLYELDARHRLVRVGQASLRPVGDHYPGGSWRFVYRDPESGSGVATLVGPFFDSALMPPVDPAAIMPAPTTVTRPGPTDPTSRLVWLATRGEGWMPSPAEEDERWHELEALVAQMRRDRGRTDRTKVLRG